MYKLLVFFIKAFSDCCQFDSSYQYNYLELRVRPAHSQCPTDLNCKNGKTRIFLHFHGEVCFLHNGFRARFNSGQFCHEIRFS